MAYVLSIIANPATPVIDRGFLDKLIELSPDSALSELVAGIAYDLSVTQATPQILQAARDVGQGLPVDINLLPTQNRRKKLLIADMDSTIIQQECIDEIAEYAGKREEIADITERAMRGELDFEAALKERVAMLAGLPVSVLAQTVETNISLTPGARALVQTMNAQNAVTALVSGGFTYFTSRVAQITGFTHTQANELLVADGKLAGKVAEPILGRAAKQDALLKIAGEHAIDLAETLAVGDGANDLAMLGRAGLGVAFHAKPAVAEAADVRIDHSDLTALLYLQGIPQSEFVS